MPQDDDIFNTEQERFEQRFSFLHTLAKPEPLWHQHYLQAMSTGASTPADMLGVRSNVSPVSARPIAPPCFCFATRVDSFGKLILCIAQFAEECYMHGRNLAHALLPEV